MGDFFDVNAVLSPDEVFWDDQPHDIDNPYLYSTTQDSGKHTYNKLSRRCSHGSIRSKG